MSRSIHKLSAARVKSTQPGFYSDGGNLYLQITLGADRNVRRSWVFRYQMPGKKPRDLGLGSANTVSLTGAREAALQCRRLVHAGVDPLEQRKAEKARALAEAAKVVTFDQATAEYFKEYSTGWSVYHRRNWGVPLRLYASPILGKLSVADITMEHILKVLSPIWREKTETAQRLRGRVEKILDFATTRKFRQGDNPARWKGHLATVLTSPKKLHKTKNYAAMPIDSMPAFMERLRQRQDTVAAALQFTILTAVRQADVLRMRHSDVNEHTKTWTIAAFSKTGEPHDVPLSDAALEAYRKARAQAAELGLRSEYAFVNEANGRPLAQESMSYVLAALVPEGGVTVHGFRSTFRDWCGNKTKVPREIAEQALGHLISNPTERAYRRSSALEKRRPLMQAWANFCTKPTEANVVAFKRTTKGTRGHEHGSGTS